MTSKTISGEWTAGAAADILAGKPSTSGIFAAAGLPLFCRFAAAGFSLLLIERAHAFPVDLTTS
jgi:hypothetical protein